MMTICLRKTFYNFYIASCAMIRWRNLRYLWTYLYILPVICKKVLIFFSPRFNKVTRLHAMSLPRFAIVIYRMHYLSARNRIDVHNSSPFARPWSRITAPPSLVISSPTIFIVNSITSWGRRMFHYVAPAPDSRRCGPWFIHLVSHVSQWLLMCDTWKIV